jgi:hypothetical protein
MVDYAEVRWNDLPEVIEASLEFKKSLAFETVKVMVMSLAARLVSWRLSRNLYRDEPALIGQSLYRSIYCCHSQSADLFLRQMQHFVGSQRTIVLLKDLADLATLLRVPMKRLG